MFDIFNSNPKKQETLLNEYISRNLNEFLNPIKELNTSSSNETTISCDCWSDILKLNRNTFMKGWKPTTNQYKSLYDQLFHYYFDYPVEIEKAIESLDQTLQWFPPQWFENGKLLPSGRMGQVYMITCRIPHQKPRQKMVLREINLAMLKQKEIIRLPKQVIGITAIRCNKYHSYKLALVFNAMDYSLEQLITQVDQWTFQKTCRITMLIASHLRDLHNTMYVHPNFQPRNILVSNIHDEHKIDLKIVDGQEDWPSLPLSTRYGRWPYISPEITYDDATQLTLKSNIYSFGIILWQLVSGVIFPNSISVCPSVYQINDLKHVDPMYQDLIIRCLSKEPNNRPSAETICQILTSILMNDIMVKKRRDTYNHLRVNAIRERQLIIAKYLAQSKPFHKAKQALHDLMEGSSISKRMMIQVTLSLERHWQQQQQQQQEQQEKPVLNVNKKQHILPAKQHQYLIEPEIKYHSNETIYYDADLTDLVQMGYA